MAVKGTDAGQRAEVSAGRRVLVGTNVIVALVLALALAGVLQWLCLRTSVRADMTSTGVNSLTPASERLVRSLEGNIRLTSLYFETDREDEDQPKYRAAVSDLLGLYEGLNRARVTAEWVNPLKDHDKYQQVFTRLGAIPRFAKEIAPYQARIDKFHNEIESKLDALLEQELTQVGQLGGGLGNTDERAPVTAVEQAMMQLSSDLQTQRRSVNDALAADYPEYATATSALTRLYNLCTQSTGRSLVNIGQFGANHAAQNPDMPADQAEFLRGAADRYADLIAELTREVEELRKLEPLELDRVVTQLMPTGNALLVETDEDARVVDFETFWPSLGQMPPGRRPAFKDRAFKGEEKLTSAILRVTHQEQTAVVFVRYGGMPLFVGGFMPNQPPAPLAQMKAQLEDANFVVEEWDLKSSLRSPKIDPAPTRTLYVVFKPIPPQGGPMNRDPNERPFDQTHRQALLDAMGDNPRALFIAGWAPGPFGPIPSTYEYRDYLKDTWGIEVDSSVALIRAVSVAPGKYQFLRQQPPLVMGDLTVGAHVIVGGANANLLSLPACAPLELADPAPEGVTHARLVTQPTLDGVWGARDIMKYQDQGEFVTKVEGDGEGPFLLAVAAKKDEGRVVVVSSGDFAWDQIAFARRLSLGAAGLMVRSVNPGNVTLLTNSLHWLNDNEEYMNLGQPINTSTLEIKNPTALSTVKLITIVGMPFMVAVCGVVVWWVRRG